MLIKSTNVQKYHDEQSCIVLCSKYLAQRGIKSSVNCNSSEAVLA